MKKSFYRIFLLGLILTFSSCAKDYLDTKPERQIEEDKLLATLGGAQTALNGVYRLFYQQFSGSEQDGHAAMMIAMDLLGEDVVMSGRGTDLFYYVHRWRDHRSEEEGHPLFAYRLYYRIVANANLILDRIKKHEDPVNPQPILNASPRDIATLKGEALALRAFGHFMAVQLFAKRYNRASAQLNDPADTYNPHRPESGVPLLLTYTLEPQHRASIQAVYDQVNQDLDDAIVLLEGGAPRIYKTHIDKSVAHGLKARVALTQQNWPDARDHAMEARKKYTLMSHVDYLSGFNNILNNEWMWGAQQKEQHVPTYGGFWAYMASNFNSVTTRTNAKMINRLLYAEISETDIRRRMWCDDVNDIDNFPGILHGTNLTPIPNQMRVRLMHNKFRVPNPVTRAGDIPLMRAAEMYLIEAEARAQLNDATAETVLKEFVTARDTEVPSTYSPPADLITEIKWQRRSELWGEGFRFLDLKRYDDVLNRGVPNTTGVTTTWSVVSTLPGTSTTTGKPSQNSKWQYVFPRRETEANPYINNENQ